MNPVSRAVPVSFLSVFVAFIKGCRALKSALRTIDARGTKVMAFTIKIYQRDEYLYSLLKKRLLDFYPDAYIINPYLDHEEQDGRFSNYTRVLYDPADIKEDDISPYTASPLRCTEDGGIIDCAKLIPFINTHEDAPVTKMQIVGSISAVIPFVYSDVRDTFIKDLARQLPDSDYNIRLDFTSKLRALYRSTSGCNMTSLLEACRSKKFTSEDILKYCNMDETGFLTPGCCKGHDDVYELGIERSITLLNHASDLAHSKNKLVNVLAVIEGFKTKELPELLGNCDKVYILLPARSSSEDLGSRELISMLTKTLGSERIEVRYAEDMIDNEYSGHGRLVV